MAGTPRLSPGPLLMPCSLSVVTSLSNAIHSRVTLYVLPLIELPSVPDSGSTAI